MFEPRALQRAAIWRVDGLAPLLLVSLLIHLLLIALPGRPGTGGGDDGDRLVLSASLRHSGKLAAIVARGPSRRASAPAPVLGPAAPVPAASAEAMAEPAADWAPLAVFYETQALSVKPVALSEPVLDAGDAGEVVLTLWIDDQGAVVEVSVERSDLPADRLAAVADAFRLVRFTPGELNGQKVGAAMRIEVSYDDERLPVEP
ncbi:MAG: hypothetical protein H6R17_3348 [Proteobacteria bacterium]|nr:hypothetical protein [Pseudomonadota bacterium]